jgi:hypothetical protein
MVVRSRENFAACGQAARALGDVIVIELRDGAAGLADRKHGRSMPAVAHAAYESIE